MHVSRRKRLFIIFFTDIFQFIYEYVKDKHVICLDEMIYIHKKNKVKEGVWIM